MGSPIRKVVQKIGACQNKLQWWSKNCFGNITQQLVEKKKFLKKAEEVALRGGDTFGMIGLKVEISGLLTLEEKMWHQRARTLWM